MSGQPFFPQCSLWQPVAAGIKEQQDSVKSLFLVWNACRVQIVMLRGGCK
jgi:hypothetical protein